MSTPTSNCQACGASHPYGKIRCERCGRPLVFPSFVCPDCGAVSFNPTDIKERYCGRCRAFK